MTQNLQTATSPDQQPASTLGEDLVQDARSLIDHLNSALSANADGMNSNEPAAPEIQLPETPSFARAIMRQTDQIHYLVQQINRLDSDTEVAKLRAVVVDLCGALTDVTLRIKQDTSQAAGKIKSLMEAMTIIGGGPDGIDPSQDIGMLLSGAKAAAGRLASLEQLSKEIQAATLALEDSESRSQNKIRDLSAALIKLSENIESGRHEVSGLQRQVGSVDQALAQVLAKLDGAIEAYRGEFSGLQQRIASADRILAQVLAKVDGAIEAYRREFSGLQQRIASADRTLAQGLKRLDDAMEAHRADFAGWQQRIESADQALAEVMARLTTAVEFHRGEIAGLQQRSESTDRTLTEGLAALGEHATVLRNDLGQINQRLAIVEDSSMLHSAHKEKIDGLGRRLLELERQSAEEIKNWKQQESERNTALISKLEILEQKNHVLAQGTEQTVARLNKAEQAIATVVQRQKALSSVHDRVVRLLLANTDLQA